jgi:transcriptional regulator with XRE-family HTH domain
MFERYSNNIINNLKCLVELYQEEYRKSSKGNFSYMDLSKKAGVSYPYINNIKRGTSQNFSLKVLLKLCSFFSISLEELLSENRSLVFSTGRQLLSNTFLIGDYVEIVNRSSNSDQRVFLVKKVFNDRVILKNFGEISTVFIRISPTHCAYETGIEVSFYVKNDYDLLGGVIDEVRYKRNGGFWEARLKNDSRWIDINHFRPPFHPGNSVEFCNEIYEVNGICYSPDRIWLLQLENTDEWVPSNEVSSVFKPSYEPLE